MLNKIKRGFTLVELIIVITILSILATIAFISFQWYSKNARDGNRLSNLKNIDIWLEIYKIQTLKYPMPEDYITLFSSWIIIWYQWYFWDEASRLIKISKTPTDPLDGLKLTYAVNDWQLSYQLLTFLESNNTISLWNFSYEIYANNIDYANRIPKTILKELWILLWGSWSDLNRPIQEFKNISFTWIDVKTYNWTIGWFNKWNLKAIFNWNDIIIWKSENLYRLWNFYRWKYQVLMKECSSWWGKIWQVLGPPSTATKCDWIKCSICEKSITSTIDDWLELAMPNTWCSTWWSLVSNSVRLYICKANIWTTSFKTWDKVIMESCPNWWIQTDTSFYCTSAYCKICEKK